MIRRKCFGCRSLLPPFGWCDSFALDGCYPTPDSVVDAVVDCEHETFLFDCALVADFFGVHVVLVVADCWEECVVVDADAGCFQFPFLVVVDETPFA